MADFPLRYSKHARQRMRQRAITEAAVRHVLRLGDVEPDPEVTGAFRSVGTHRQTRRDIRVIYRDEAGERVIITVMYVD